MVARVSKLAVSGFLRPTRRITDHFKDECFQAVDCTATDMTARKCNYILHNINCFIATGSNGSLRRLRI